MKTKICTKCNINKSIKDFYIRKDRPSGYMSRCKSCKNKATKEYSKTELGLVSVIYNSQKKSSIERNHALPSYTLNELKNWIFNNKNWEYLYNNWIESGCDKMKIPSLDRLDDSKGYDFDNIRLVTWNDNEYKASEDRRNGKLGTISPHYPVIQLTNNGFFIAEYISMREAERQTSVNNSNISKACKNHTTAGGFKWQYKVCSINHRSI